MRFLLIAKELAWAAATAFSALIFYVLMTSARGVVGISVVTVAAGALFAAYAAPLFVHGWDWLARLLSLVGQGKRAELLAQQSLALWEKLVGRNGPGTAEKRGNLARLYADLGRSDEAEELYRQVRQSWKKSPIGLASPLCAYLDSYAELLARTERRQEASEIRQQIRGWRAAHALKYTLYIVPVLLAFSFITYCARLHENIVSSHIGQFARVRDYVEELANLERAWLGASGAAEVYSNYGGMHRGWRIETGPVARRMHEDEAYWGLTRALPYCRQSSSIRPGLLVCVLGDLAEIELSRGNLQEAARLYKEALAAMPAWEARRRGLDFTRGRKKVDALLALGSINAATRHYGESERYYRQASLVAAEIWGRDCQFYIDALAGLAEARLQQGDLSGAEKLLDEAIRRQEQVVQEGFRALVRTEEEMDRLVRILLQRAEILRLTDRKKEAEAVMRHIDQWQAKLRPQFHLDDQLQARIVELVKDTTGKLLCLKYHTKNAPEARETLSEILTPYAFSELVGIPWYPKDSNSVRAYAADSNAPDAVNLEFDQISVTSPDNMGFLTVHAQGRSRLATRAVPVSEGHFAFVYKVKLPENSREKMVIAKVTEADSGASE
ncbi:MAG TPA: tetratricopeptide repeat protein, partial [Candidatus Obscuribacterales bacterium]